MKVLVVLAHPVAESFAHAVQRGAVGGLERFACSTCTGSASTL